MSEQRGGGREDRSLLHGGVAFLFPDATPAGQLAQDSSALHPVPSPLRSHGGMYLLEIWSDAGLLICAPIIKQ